VCQPTQRAITGSLSRTMVKDAPTSPRSAKSCSNLSRTASKPATHQTGYGMRRHGREGVLIETPLPSQERLSEKSDARAGRVAILALRGAASELVAPRFPGLVGDFGRGFDSRRLHRFGQAPRRRRATQDSPASRARRGPPRPSPGEPSSVPARRSGSSPQAELR
jgi:hypothetical protein